ncbi:MAG TPA: Wzz/FepE/Etk N-terminal domain-containing protein [Rubrobacteraceae bacterium]|nr:Wzz/FepE/Etk N-terminal domain-containing protein [Rubrobacteraceae bacterium]
MPQSTKRREGRQSRSWRGWQREQRDDLTLSEARHVLWKRRAVVAGCTILFLAIALLYVLSQDPVYTAEATLSVRSQEEIGPTTGNFDEILSGLQDPAATSRGRFTEEAAERAGWEDGQDDFNERLEWEPVNEEEVRVRFSASTPEEAARAANAYAEVFVERVRELEGRPVGGSIAVDAGIERVAEPPERRSDREVFLAAIAAGVGGLLVGGIVALFLESRARRWSGSIDAERTLRAPVLAVIPDYSDGFPDLSPLESEARGKPGDGLLSGEGRRE